MPTNLLRAPRILDPALTMATVMVELSRGRGDASAVRSGPAVDPYLRQTPARTAKYLDATIQTEKCLSQVSQRHT